jgi:hypothetical protein
LWFLRHEIGCFSGRTLKLPLYSSITANPELDSHLSVIQTLQSTTGFEMPAELTRISQQFPVFLAVCRGENASLTGLGHGRCRAGAVFRSTGARIWKAGVRPVAISVDTVQQSAGLSRKAGYTFPILYG